MQQRSPLGRHSPALQEDEDVIRRRKMAAERRVQERHRALLVEQRQKHKTTVEERQRLMTEMREREAKEMKKRQEELHKHLEWLERDKARKKEILERQHQATSRTVQKPGTGFGSSTPRELSYLNNLPKAQKTYDKKLSPPPETRPALTPKHISTPPRRVPNMMTSSMYVPSSTPRRPPPAKVAPQTHKTPKPKNLMTQSFYTPSRPTRMTVSAPRPKPRTSPTPPQPKARLPPVNPNKTRKPASPAKTVIIEETPIPEVFETSVESEPPVDDAPVLISFESVETPAGNEEMLVVSSPLEESEEKTVESSERGEEQEAVPIEQPVPHEEESESLIEMAPVAVEQLVEAKEEAARRETVVETVPAEPTDDFLTEEIHQVVVEHVEHNIEHLPEPVEHHTNLFDELAAVNNSPEPMTDDLIEIDYSSDPILHETPQEIHQKPEEQRPAEDSVPIHKIDEAPVECQVVNSLDEFLLPGAVPESHSVSEAKGVTLADELSSALLNGEKPESIEESKLITSRPPSPPVAPKNEELERRREEDKKHNEEMKARFAAVKARIGRVSPPNVNGSPGLPPPAPTAAQVDNGKPLSDSTAALLQRLSKMGALKSTKAAESVESLLTRHSSDPKMDLAPDDPVSLI